MSLLLVDSAEVDASVAADSLRLVRFVAPHFEAAQPVALADLTTDDRKLSEGGGVALVPGERDRGNIRLDVPWAGEVPTLDRHGNARLNFTLRLLASDPVADADAIVAAILTAPSRCAIEWRRGGRPTYFPLRGDADWTPSYSMRERRQGGGMTVAFSIEVAPWAHRGSMDIADDFAVDSLADYTFDVGAGTLSVSGGQLVPSDTAEKRLYHSARGFRYSDAQGTLKRTHGTTAPSALVGPMLRRLDASNALIGGLVPASNIVAIYKFDGSAFTLLASAAITALTAGQVHWMRFRAEGNVLTAEHWTAEPTPMGTPATTVSHTLSGANATKFGTGIAGDAGVRIVPGDLTERYDELRVRPYTYRNRTLPQSIALEGQVPGDLPALCDLEITPSGGTAVPVFALAGWSRRATTPTFGVAPLGIIQGEAATTLVTFAIGSNANALGGSYVQTTAAGAGSALARWQIDASALPLDADGHVTVEVFARVIYGNSHTGLKWVLSATPRTTSSAARYSDRGSAGLSPPVATASVWRFVRLGRIRLSGEHLLRCDVSWSAGTQTVGLDYLVIVPAASFVASPMGVALDSAYPQFVYATTETMRVLLHDGEGTLARPLEAPLLGFGLGRRIEVPTGNADLIVKLSSLVPENPTANADSEQLSHDATVRARLLPRFAYA